jgi:L-Ala-D/L-Glu epimerase
MNAIKWPSTDVVVEHVDAYLLRMPLKRPYENALGRLDAFDVILIAMSDKSGRTGWGEACPVLGYSPESPGQAWDHAKRILPSLVGKTAREIGAVVAGDIRHFPFVVSALHEALDDLVGAPSMYGEIPPRPVELLGTVNTLDHGEGPGVAMELLDQGYKVLKVKVGYDPESDAARVEAIADAVAGRAMLRMDANQGYSLDQALDFARRVPTEAVEVFEQPVPANRWDWIQAIARERILPLMLDESIYGVDDIRRAASVDGITAVKLKMSKAGGPSALAQQVALCRSYGLDVVIGNGVASDLGCYHEALCYDRLGLTAAAEMNGFLKTVDSLLTIPLTVEHARLKTPDVSFPPVDIEKVTGLASQEVHLDRTTVNT